MAISNKEVIDETTVYFPSISESKLFNPKIRLINLLKQTNHGAIYSTQLLNEMSNYPYSKNDDIQTKFLSIVDNGKKNYYTYILLDPR